jgi:NhaP-type Na+/H+ or K+/H+ antiporter
MEEGFLSDPVGSRTFPYLIVAISGEPAWADLVRLLLEALRVLLTGPRLGLVLIWAGSRFVRGLPLLTLETR